MLHSVAQSAAARPKVLAQDIDMKRLATHALTLVVGVSIGLMLWGYATTRIKPVPLEVACDADWLPDEQDSDMEVLPLLLEDGSLVTASLEYGEMKPVTDHLTTFLTHTNRVAFEMYEKKRFGFQIRVSKPVRVLVFVTYPAYMNRDGEWRTSHMHPSQQVDRSQYYYYDYSRREQDSPGNYSFVIYINGLKVRTLDIEVAFPDRHVAVPDEDVAGWQALMAIVDRHIRHDNIVHVSSERPGQLTMGGGWRGNAYLACLQTNISFLKDLNIDTLSLEGMGLADLSPLKHMPLRSLRLHYIGTPDLSPLAALSVTNLNLAVSVTNLAFLRKLPLDSLELHEPEVSSLEPLRGMSISRLVIDLRDSPATDLAVLGTLPLKDLEIRLYRNDRDLSWLTKLTKLGRLRLSSATPLDMSVLSRTSIDKLELDCPWLKDLNALKGMKLTHLSVDGWYMKDISGIEGMPLKVVDLHCTGVEDLTPLRGMPITDLNIAQTRVRDIGILRGMPIKVLNMALTKITDLRPLAGMPLESLHLGHITSTTKGVDIVRSMQRVKFLGGTISSRDGRSYHDFEDCASAFWKEYDAAMAEAQESKTDD